MPYDAHNRLCRAPSPVGKLEWTWFLQRTKAGAYEVRATGPGDRSVVLADVIPDMDGDVSRNQRATASMVVLAAEIASEASELANTYADHEQGGGLRTIGDEPLAVGTIRSATAYLADESQDGRSPPSFRDSSVSLIGGSDFRSDFNELSRNNRDVGILGAEAQTRFPLHMPLRVEMDLESREQPWAHVYDSVPYQVFRLNVDAFSDPDSKPQAEAFLRAVRAAPFLFVSALRLVRSAEMAPRPPDIDENGPSNLSWATGSTRDLLESFTHRQLVQDMRRSVGEVFIRQRDQLAILSSRMLTMIDGHPELATSDEAAALRQALTPIVSSMGAPIPSRDELDDDRALGKPASASGEGAGSTAKVVVYPGGDIQATIRADELVAAGKARFATPAEAASYEQGLRRDDQRGQELEAIERLQSEFPEDAPLPQVD